MIKNKVKNIIIPLSVNEIIINTDDLLNVFIGVLNYES
jgi:hypothetical protein